MRPRISANPGRRTLVAIGLAALAAVIGLIAALSSGGSSHGFQLGGQAPTLLSTPGPSGQRAGATRARPVPFKPAPRAVALAASLGLGRQVAQVFAVTMAGPTPASVSALGGLSWGGLVFGSPAFQSDSQITALAAAAAGAVRSTGPVPPLLAVPQEGGRANVLPGLPPQSEPTIGAGGDATVAQSQALLAGRRLRALGFNMTLAPFADVDTDGGPIGDRLYSTDPVAVAALAGGAVRGYNAAGIISAPGHFPGEGAASADPDQMTATVGGPLSFLRSHDLVPFAAIAQQAPVIMMSNAVYAAFDGVTPASLLQSAVRLLREDYGYEGVIMSGDLDATLQATGGDAGAAAIAALHAGNDLLYISGTPAEQLAAYSSVLAEARRSPALRRRINGAVLRVLTLKVRFGVVR